MTVDPAPQVTVIVAVHDVAGQIADAIVGLRAQTLADFEALVIDDGSTDGSGEIALAAIGDDPRFHLVRQENQGLSGARNTGLDRARGAWIAFLDGDDAYAPDFLARLLDAAQSAGAAWAASGIALVFPDAQVPHPALHGDVPPRAPVIELGDATVAARVFPSAWNKIYRADLFDTLRYTPGTWYEDHEVFWALAARHPRLAYVDAPLYLHRRERPGQITSQESERVFEQFAVLDRLAPLVRDGGFAQAARGFSQLATRLVHERALVVRDPERRTRYVAAVRDSMARLGWEWVDQGDREISEGLHRAVLGLPPVAVYLTAGPDLQARLDSVRAQTMLDCVVHVVEQDVTEMTPPQAPFIVLGPGETLLPDALMQLLGGMRHHGAACVMGGLTRADGRYHDGWTDNRLAGFDWSALGRGGALVPEADRVARMLRVAPTRANRLFAPDAVTPNAFHALLASDWPGAQAGLLSALVGASGPIAQIALPVARVDGPPPAPPGGALTAARWARALPEPGAGLPRGWRGVLALRRFRATGATGVLPWLRALAALLVTGLAPAARAARPDPETPRWVHWALRPLQSACPRRNG